MRFAIVENGRVVNMAAASEEFGVGQGWVPATEETRIGDAWDGVEFTPAAPVVAPPPSVSMAQARKALILAGLLPDVQAALESIPDATQRALALADWEYATVVRRESPLVVSMAAALGLTAGQVNDLFVTASTL